MSKQKKEFDVAGKFLDERQSKINLNDSDSGLRRYLTNDVTSELDTCLQGQRGSLALKRMSRNDSIIGGILSSYKNPIQSVNWSVEEIPDATPKETEIVEILNKWFFKRNDFGTQLNQILGMLPMGFSLFEKFFTRVNFDNQSYMMPVLAERSQPSIRKIDYKALTVEQQTTEQNLVYMPFKDLVFFTFRQDGNDRRGVSLLRQAYNDYLDKKEVKQASIKGIIRSMIGLVVGTVPESVNSESENFKSFNQLIIELGDRNFNGISDSAIKQANYEIDILNSSTFDLQKMKDYIAYLDSSMTMSVLTQFMTLGQSGGGGSYSLGRDSSDMHLDGLQYIIDYIEKTYSQQIIHQTVAMNWADVDPLKFNMVGSNLNKKASKEFADTVGSLVKNGIMKVEPQDEVKIRKMYDLPEIDLAQREAEEEENQEKAETLGGEEEKESSQQVDNTEEKEENEEAKENKEETIKLSENYKTTKERKAFIKDENKKISRFSRASLQLIAEEISKGVRRQLNKGSVEAQGLKDLQINNIGAYKKKLGQKLAGLSMQAWKNALRNSKPELEKIRKQSNIKLAEVKPSELPTQVLTSFVLNQSDTMAEKQINDLREAAILQANTQATKDLPVNNVMAMVDESMDKYIDNANRIEGGNELAIVQSVNYGEMQYYKSIEDNLWGYRFANDIPETAICKSLVNKTYPVSSSELDIIQPPLHFRCDSYLVPIYKSEEKPEIDNFVPNSTILKQKTI